MPESFITNISHQLIDYRKTLREFTALNTNLTGGFVLKNQFETLILKISGIQI